ncbi:MULTISPECIES: glycerophosphodiester phosphodiesterase [Primorskyibacter]|uniref:Glycerophosphoryl diester phosphodiesterase n=1 Tax=Primorskyibacter flagellatus TaxID=1387277 RepID=A0A1W2ELI2_9RHOB|nr:MULTISPECIES: glycerophosphodiester phosphodiesterase family protein [Primorskyibacter]SMD10372.1 glycerophosphoryl diester phosphodiesterase [Primorskyibacter flagellatus]
MRSPAQPRALVCHRGSTLFGPENSLRSAAGCFRNGYDYVEIDIQTSADGQPVILHDTTVDRMTDGQGAVADMPLAELKRLWLTDASGETSDERIPTLNEMLSMAGPGYGFMVEIKQADPGLVAAAVDRFGLTPRCFFWSFDPSVLTWLKKTHPELRLMVRARDHASVDQALAAYAADVIEFETDLHDRVLADEARNAGASPMVYAQYGTDQEVYTLNSWGIDLINTDRPDRFVSRGDPM